MRKQPYRTEAISPRGFFGQRNIDYPMTKNPASQMNIQFMGPKNDLEKLVEAGLKNLKFFHQFIKSTSMPSVLDYAESRVVSHRQLNDQEKRECILIINLHNIRIIQPKALKAFFDTYLDQNNDILLVKKFIQQSPTSVLKYGKKRIIASKKLNDEQKQELLSLIDEHHLQKKKKIVEQ